MRPAHIANHRDKQNIQLGTRFGKLTVTSIYSFNRYLHARSVCDCGGHKAYRVSVFLEGKVKDCGSRCKAK